MLQPYSSQQVSQGYQHTLGSCKASQAHLAVDGSLAAAAVGVRRQQIGRMPAQLARQGGCSSLIRRLPVPALSTPQNPPVTPPAWLGPVPRMHHHLCRQVKTPLWHKHFVDSNVLMVLNAVTAAGSVPHSPIRFGCCTAALDAANMHWVISESGSC